MGRDRLRDRTYPEWREKKDMEEKTCKVVSGRLPVVYLFI